MLTTSSLHSKQLLHVRSSLVTASDCLGAETGIHDIPGNRAQSLVGCLQPISPPKLLLGKANLNRVTLAFAV